MIALTANAVLDIGLKIQPIQAVGGRTSFEGHGAVQGDRLQASWSTVVLAAGRHGGRGRPRVRFWRERALPGVAGHAVHAQHVRRPGPGSTSRKGARDKVVCRSRLGGNAQLLRSRGRVMAEDDLLDSTGPQMRTAFSGMPSHAAQQPASWPMASRVLSSASPVTGRSCSD
jgi:hypothetical protein